MYALWIQNTSERFAVYMKRMNKFSDLNGILCDSGAMLYQLNYEASLEERVKSEFNLY